MFFNEKIASYSHNIPANETIVNGNIMGIWQEYLLNDIQFFHTLMWILYTHLKLEKTVFFENHGYNWS